MFEAGRILCQFKITLEESKPPIWRRFLFPEIYRFYDLHVAIQSVMGWEDYQEHYFTIKHPRHGFMEKIGLPREIAGGEDRISCGKMKSIFYYFIDAGFTATYTYGDWKFFVLLETFAVSEGDQNYPQCIDGRYASPPEGCGNMENYRELLKIIANPSHEKYYEKTNWVKKYWSDEYCNPTKFDPREVVFADPEERFILASVYHTPDMHMRCKLRRTFE